MLPKLSYLRLILTAAKPQIYSHYSEILSYTGPELLKQSSKWHIPQLPTHIFLFSAPVSFGKVLIHLKAQWAKISSSSLPPSPRCCGIIVSSCAFRECCCVSLWLSGGVIISQLEGCGFVVVMSWSVLGQDTEPQIAPTVGQWCMGANVFVKADSSLLRSLCHHGVKMVRMDERDMEC